MATDYNKFKVTELKDILKQRGIPSTGLSRKQQIVEALEKHDVEQEAEKEVEQPPAEVEEVSENVPEAHAPQRIQEESAEDAPGTTREATEPIAAEMPADAPSAHDDPLPLPAASEGNAEETPAQEATEESDKSAKEEPVSDRIVLENNDPLSKEPSALNTPQRVSPAAESVSSDTRKRKRRSPTPPLSQDSVNKKLKAAGTEPIIKLPEDEMKVDEQKVVEDAPVAVERSAETAGEVKTVQPYGSSDDMMQVDSDKLPGDSKSTGQSLPESKEVDMKDASGQAVLAEDKEEETATTPAIHPATRALYIRELVRPLQSGQLRSHLVASATPANGSSDDSMIEAFHIDTIRTHAFVLFTSISAAARARSALHNQIWPKEPTRKALWVDFLPEDKVKEWIEVEQEADDGKGKGGVRRWEVVYKEGPDGMEAKLHEGSSMPSGPVRQQSQSNQSMGMPNAPIGPRGDRRPSFSSRAPPSPDKLKRPTPTPAPAQPSSASFDVLDQRFKHTTTKPKLYYLPKDSELVNKRLDAMAAITSRDWDPEKEGSFTGTGEVRRYTFEDGDRVVDGGADIGNFGRPAGMEIPPPRRGGGGWRGGRR